MTGVTGIMAGSSGAAICSLISGESTTYPAGIERNNWGFSSSLGSITPGTFRLTGTNIVALLFVGTDGLATDLRFSVEGTHAQSVFTSMTIGSTVFTTASATRTTGSTTTWTWATPSNLFTVTGATYLVTFI